MKTTILCPNCEALIGEYPRKEFLLVEIRCKNCNKNLKIRSKTVKSNVKKILGAEIPTTISLDEHQEYVEDTTFNDPTDVLNSELDREFMLNKLSDRDKQVVLLLEEGYLAIEIAEKLGVSRQAIHQVLKRLRKSLL